MLCAYIKRAGNQGYYYDIYYNRYLYGTNKYLLHPLHIHHLHPNTPLFFSLLHYTTLSHRYYEDPFKKENLEHGGGLKRMCIAYVEGLCWVMKYYYQV